MQTSRERLWPILSKRNTQPWAPIKRVNLFFPWTIQLCQPPALNLPTTAPCLLPSPPLLGVIHHQSIPLYTHLPLITTCTLWLSLWTGYRQHNHPLCARPVCVGTIHCPMSPISKLSLNNNPKTKLDFVKCHLDLICITMHCKLTI